MCILNFVRRNPRKLTFRTYPLLQRVETEKEVNIVENQSYINPFTDVHNKVKVFKDRLREANDSDAGLRESRLVQEAKELLGKSPRPPANISIPEPELTGERYV